jgi:hypothetical protein
MDTVKPIRSNVGMPPTRKSWAKDYVVAQFGSVGDFLHSQPSTALVAGPQ